MFHETDLWHAVKPGDLVTLSDMQTLISRLKAGNGPTPENYEISQVLTIGQRDSLATWRFLKLGETTQWLMVKIVDRNVALSILRDAPDWEPATREELVNKELLFMFVAPDNPDNFEYDELRYVKMIDESNPEVNGNAYTNFFMKPQGEQHAVAEWQPPQSGIGSLVATIVEYAAEANKGFVDSELVIVEIGSKDALGVIKFLVGRSIASVDVKVAQH